MTDKTSLAYGPHYGPPLPPSLQEQGKKGHYGETFNAAKELLSAWRAIQLKAQVFSQSDHHMGIMEGLTSRMECLMIFYLQISMMTDRVQITLAALQYSKTLIKGSYLFKLQALVEKIINGPAAFMSSTFGLQDGPIAANWSRLTKGAFGKRISSLLNLFIVIGIMPEKVDNILANEFYKTYDLKMRKRQTESIFDHIIGTMDYVLECVYPAFKTGNMYLLLDDRDMDELDREYRNAMDATNMYTVGQMTRLKETYKISEVSEIIVKLQVLQQTMIGLKARIDPAMGREFNARLIKIDKVLNDLYAGFHDSAIRVKPFSVLIRGASSHAKTTLTSILTHIISTTNQFPEGEEYSCTINGSDAFQSELKPQHIAVTFDDLGQTKPEYEKANPLFVLIQFINNVHCSALSAVAERKGQNDIRVKMVFGTTNTRDLHSAHFSAAPAAIMRRFDLIIDAEVPDENRDLNGKILQKFESQSMPDMYNLTAWTVGLRRGRGPNDDTWFLKPVVFEGNSNMGGLVEVAEYLERVTPIYYASQNAIVNSATAMCKQLHCKLHPIFTVPCIKCAKGPGEEAAFIETILCESVTSEPTGHLDIEKILDQQGANISPTILPSLENEDSFATARSQATDLLSRFSNLENHSLEDEFIPASADWFEQPALVPFPPDCSVTDGIPINEVEISPLVDRIPPDFKPKELPKEKHRLWKKFVRSQYTKWWLRNKSKNKMKIIYSDEIAENFLAFAAIPPPKKKPTKKQSMFQQVINGNGMTWKAKEDELTELEDPHDRLIRVTVDRLTPLSALREKWTTTDPKYKALLATSALLATGLLAASAYQRMYKHQGAKLSALQIKAMTPSMITDHTDKYKKNWVINMQPSPASISASREQFESRIDTHLRVIIYHEIDQNNEKISSDSYMDITPLGGGEWVLPAHTFDLKKRYMAWLLLKPKSIVGVPHMKIIVDSTNFVPYPDRDLAKLRIRRGCNWNASKYLSLKPQEPNVGDPLIIYHRSLKSVTDEECMMENPSENCIRTTVKHVGKRHVRSKGSFLGSYQHLVSYDVPPESPTFNGMCGAIVVLDTRHPIILGIHTAGDDLQGGCTCLSQEDWKALEVPTAGASIYVAEDSPFPDTVQGVPVTRGPFVHGRNAANWMESDKVHSYSHYGTIDTPQNRFKTSIVQSCLAPKMKELLDVDVTHAGPLSSSVSKARHTDLDVISEESTAIDPTILEWAKADLIQKMGDLFEAADSAEVNIKEHMHVIPLENALDGVPGVPGVDPINIKTSIGCPLNSKKSNFLVVQDIAAKYGFDTKKLVQAKELDDGTMELHYHVRFDKEKYDLEGLLEELLESLSEGRRVNIVFRSNLKDEPLTLTKVLDGKIRVFAGAPVHAIILSRMLGLTNLTTSRELPGVFEDAMGIDAHGKDWDFLYRHITQFGEDRIITGDYKAFDKSQQAELSLCAMEVEKFCMQQASFAPDALKIFDGVATEECLPIYEMAGGLIGVQKSGPSGGFWTTKKNGTINKLLMRCAYYANYRDTMPGIDLHPDNKKIPLFHEVIALATFGDDNGMGVSTKEKLFTFESIVYQLAKLGFTYTDALKTGKSYLLHHIDEASFLKRGFKFHEILRAIVAPIEIASINKSLTLTKKDRHAQDTEARIMGKNMNSALYECFLHGPETYEKYAVAFSQMKEVVGSEGDKIGDHYVVLTLMDCVERYQKSESRYDTNLELFNVPENMRPSSLITQCGLCPTGPCLITSREGRGPFGYFHEEAAEEIVSEWNNRERQRRQNSRNVDLIAQLWVNASQNRFHEFEVYYSRLTQRFDGFGTTRAQNIITKMFVRRVLQESTSLPMELVEYMSEFATDRYVSWARLVWPAHMLHRPWLDHDQEMRVTVATIGTNRQRQFARSPSQSKGSTETDGENRLELGVMTRNSLQVQAGIVRESVGTTENVNTTTFVDKNESYTTSVESTMDPTRYATADADTTLARFFERPVEIGTIKWETNDGISERIECWNAWMKNPRVANRLNNYRNFKGNLHVKFLINGNQFYYGKAFASYTPYNNNTYLNYDGDVGSVMSACQRPHIWLDPSTSLGGQLDLPFYYLRDCFDLTQSNPDDLGEIWVKTLATLQHTQGLTNPVRITVYAWATEVELSSPTQTNLISLAPQGGAVDEMETDGPVSKPAAIIEKIAGKLESIPAIAPYALATKMAAGGVARMARLFGYSRPRIVEAETPVKIWQTGDLACTDQRDSVNTLALTTKQEVTIDPRVTGLGSVDELAFKHLNEIHSYFTSTSWELTDEPNTPLISIPVSPMMYSVGSQTVPITKDYISLCTTGFTSLPFNYWQGEMSYRFQIAGSGYHKGRLLAVWDPVSAVADPEINTVYSSIIDISEERDFSITVGWGCPDPGLRVFPPFVANTGPLPYTLRALATPSTAHHNGVLTLYVLNNLVTSGSNTAPIRILCHAFSKELNYWDPATTQMKNITYAPILPTGFAPEPASLNLQSGDASMEDPSEADAPNNTEDMPMGGKANMKSMIICAGESIDSFRTCMKRYSFVRRLEWFEDTSGDSFTVLSAGANSYFPNPRSILYPMTMQSYVWNCYSGFRGSTRHRYIPRTNPTSSGAMWSCPTIARANAAWNDNFAVVQESMLSGTRVTAYNVDNSWSGMQVSNPTAGNVLSVEQPFYAPFRFLPNNYPVNSPSESLGHLYSTTLMNTTNNPVVEPHVVDHFYSIGEDYNMFFFLGVQPLWKRDYFI